MSLPYGTFVVGNKIMGRCDTCGKLVRIDKPLLGSLHICADPYHVEHHGDIDTGWVDVGQNEKEKK